MTDAARWSRMKEVFAEARERPIADRRAFVSQACADDRELQDEVMSLLDAAEGSESLPRARGAVAATALQAVLQRALGDNYEIIRVLGQGGMGAVYLASERALDRFVAIKVLRPELADAQQARERFRREARMAAQLSHPGIVPLYTFGEIGGVWYFVMRYVRGVTLAERLRVEGRIPSSEAQRILLQLAEAVDCAHQAGIIHRDIKPGNVLLDEESGRAVLADFGIARMEGAQSLTESGMIIGTPSYMSPEQAAGAHDVDERSDIYSLGAVGYAMLEGREHTSSTAMTHATPELSAIVQRALAAEPARRWSSARDVAQALDRVERSGDEVAAPLRDLPTFGPYALLWALIWIGIAALPGRDFRERALLIMIALIVPLGLLLHLWNANSEGIPLGELTRVAFWPPEWWGMWWPRSLRRPRDLWARLPWQARAVRALVSAFVVTLPLVILTRRWVDAYSVPPGCCGAWISSTEEWMARFVVVFVVAMIAWAVARGLRGNDTVRLLFGSTTPSPGWQTPALAQLVTGSSRVAPPSRDVASEHRRAVRELVSSLPAHAVSTRQAVTDATDAAAARIESIDSELAVLNRDASPGEIDRLIAQAASHEAQVTNTSDEHAELASLVRKQLGIVQRMRVRAELLADQRRQLFTLLRGLWTQLGALRDSPDAMAEARVETLAQELRREAARVVAQ